VLFPTDYHSALTLVMLENTFVFVTSDNGPQMDAWPDAGYTPFRGAKGTTWEGGIRVPGIFHWPGKIRSGVTASQPAGLVDVLPTVCGLLELDPPEDVHLDGSDLSPILIGQPQHFRRHQPLYWHLQKSRPIVAIRDGDFSLVADPDYELSTNNMFQEAWIPTIKNGSYKNFRLYNLKSDPGQTTDVAEGYPERFQQMKESLLEINSSVMADGHDW